MNEELKNILKEYFEKVEEAYQLIFKGLNISSHDEFIGKRMIQQCWEFDLNGRNQFFFHGRGCHFKNDYLDIDWDFGFNGKICGVDPWKLAMYLKNNKKNFPNYYDYRILREELEEAISKNEIMFVHGLFYFFEEKPAKPRKRGISKNK